MAYHRRLDRVYSHLTRGCAILLFGDSRSVQGSNSVPGGIFRTWDVKWAGVIINANGGNSMDQDGILHALFSRSSLTNENVVPGDTGTGSGLTNVYPMDWSEQWVDAANSVQFATGPNANFGITAGYTMDTNAGGTSGGTFKRGDPAQGRTIDSCEYFAICDNSGNHMSVRLGIENDLGTSAPWIMDHDFNEDPLGSTAAPEIKVYTTTGPDAVVNGPNMLIAPTFKLAAAYSEKGWVWIGTRLNYTGGEGCLMVVMSQGGWSITDHLPDTGVGAGANTDAKWTLGALAEYYEKCVRMPRVIVRWEVGANPAIGWDDDLATTKLAHETAILRVIDALLQASVEASDIVVELVSIWGTSPDAGGPSSRTTMYRQAFKELADENDWSFYDQLGAVIDSGNSEGNSIKTAWRRDTGHCNRDGTIGLQTLEWNAFLPQGGLRERLGSSRRGLGPR